MRARRVLETPQRALTNPTCQEAEMAAERCYLAKLTEAQVRQIRAEVGRKTHAQLAVEHDTSRGNISHIVSGKSWRSVI
jgi:hypothetical protein